MLPLLFGDEFVGRIEPRIDRSAGALRILGLWWQDGFDPLSRPDLVTGLAEALEAHRRFADVDRVVLPRQTRHRALFGALRTALAEARELGERNAVT